MSLTNAQAVATLLRADDRDALRGIAGERARFDEPLAPIGATTREENLALANALVAYDAQVKESEIGRASCRERVLVAV